MAARPAAATAPARVAAAPRCGAAATGAALLLALAGCGMTDGTAPGEDQESAADPSPGPEATEPTAPDTDPEEDAVTTPPQDPGSDPAALPTGPVPTDLDQQPRVRAAISDLAERLQVAEDEVAVAGWAQVTWPDGSIGCPEEGMMYTQALVPGEQLVLQASGELFSYHAAQEGDFTFCADPTPPVSGGETS